MISIVKYAKDKGKGGNSSGGSTTIINGGGFAGTTNNFTATMAEVAKNLTSDSPVWKLIDQKDAAILQQAVAKATAAAAANFLSKVDDDTALGVITFAAGLISQAEAYLQGGASFGEFVQGLSGGQIDNQGNAELESLLVRDSIVVPNLTVTKAAHFFKLIIDELKSIGGQIIVTAANATLDKVVPYTSGNEVAEAGDTVAYYRCYFRAKEGDEAGAKAIHNQFTAGDQAVCMTFDTAEGTSYNISSKYYWRYVQSVGTETLTEEDGSTNDYHYIDLSNTNCDANSSVPEVGDAVAQLGNQSDTSRQNAIIISAYQSIDGTVTAPSIVQYKGINDYNLSNHKLNVIAANGNVFKGDFMSVNSSTGTETLLTDLLAAMQQQINGVVAQTDNKFDIWYGHGIPTASNSPAQDWTTETLKAEHDKDLYYNLDEEAASQGGNCYRWSLVNGTWKWVKVTDAHTLAALDQLTDVAADDILSGGMEKTRVYVEWMAAIQDYLKYKTQVTEMGLTSESAWANYLQGLNELGTYLDGGDPSDNVTWDVRNYPGTETSDTATPTWIKSANRGTTTRNIGASNYRLYWGDYYACLAALLTSMGITTYTVATTNRGQVFVTDYTLANPYPTPPYKSGDLWYYTDNELVKHLYICNTNSPGASFDWSHWQDITDLVSGEIRSHLLQMMEQLLQISVFAQVWSLSGTSTVRVYLCDDYQRDGHYNFDTSDDTLHQWEYDGSYTNQDIDGVVGDICYTVDGIYQYQNVTRSGVTTQEWVQLSNVGDLMLTMAAIYSVTGNIMLRVWKTLVNNASRYDVAIKPASFTAEFAAGSNSLLNGNKKTITADGYCYYWNTGEVWEPLGNNETHAVMKNLGDALVFAVWGTDSSSQIALNKNAITLMTKKVSYDSNGNPSISGSGLITADDAATLISQATDADGNVLANAHLGTFITKYKDSNNNLYYISGIRMKATEIIIEGQYFQVDANGKLTCSDANVQGTIRANKLYRNVGTVNVTDGATYDGNAEILTLTGRGDFILGLPSANEGRLLRLIGTSLEATSTYRPHIIITASATADSHYFYRYGVSRGAWRQSSIYMCEDGTPINVNEPPSCTLYSDGSYWYIIENSANLWMEG